MKGSPIVSHHLWPAPEQQLLLNAALLEPDRAVASFMAWRRRVSMDGEFSPGAYRLLPLVYHRMHPLVSDDPVMGRLKGVYRRSWVETNRLFHATRPAIAALVEAGIEVMLAKGAPLALGAYSQIALRPMADIDVLVPRAQLDETLGVLRRVGWRMTLNWDVETVRYRHAMQFLSQGDTGDIDLHWRPLYETPESDDDRAVRATAEPFDFLGVLVKQPDPTWHLFLVVVHGVRWNEETPVRWIPDAMMILATRGRDVDWERLPALAAEHRVSFRLGLGLDYLARHFDAPIPREVISRVSANRITVAERLENSVLLANDAFYEPSVLRYQWAFLSEYLRFASPRKPLAFASGYTHFLRYRLGLNGRRELFGMALQSVRRRLRAWRGHAYGTADPAALAER